MRGRQEWRCLISRMEDVAVVINAHALGGRRPFHGGGSQGVGPQLFDRRVDHWRQLWYRGGCVAFVRGRWR